MANYFRITAYFPAEDFSFIVDSHGRFEKLWQFSAYLVSKGVKVLEVANSDTFLDGNMNRAKEHPEYIYLQSAQRGQPTKTTIIVDGKTYRASKTRINRKSAQLIFELRAYLFLEKIPAYAEVFDIYR